MTEDEAKTKWCPFVRVGAEGLDVSWNRALNDTPIKHTACIASACMAWRWEEKHKVFHRATELWSKSKGCRVSSAYNDDADWRPVGGDGDPPAFSPTGYCGLAGKPA